MKHFHLLSNIVLLAALAILLVCLTGCDGKNEKKTDMDSNESSVTPMNSNESSVTEEDLASSKLAHLVKAIEDGDAETVADFVIYPMARPAPIPSIKNKEEFIAYFPIMFDEIFRQELRKTSFSKAWEEMGFRGVMYSQGILWIDGSIAEGGAIREFIYSSEAEKALYSKLLGEEKKTLHESLLEEDFAPVLCFETTDGKIAGRIDRFNMDKYRIALFDIPVHPKDEPKETFLCTMVPDGTNGSRDYLDIYWQHVVSINKDGPDDAPDLTIQSREHWHYELDPPQAATYRTWKEILGME